MEYRRLALPLEESKTLLQHEYEVLQEVSQEYREVEVENMRAELRQAVSGDHEGELEQFPGWPELREAFYQNLGFPS